MPVNRAYWATLHCCICTCRADARSPCRIVDSVQLNFAIVQHMLVLLNVRAAKHMQMRLNSPGNGASTYMFESRFSTVYFLRSVFAHGPEQGYELSSRKGVRQYQRRGSWTKRNCTHVTSAA